MGKVDRFEGMATGTTVDAGTLTQKVDSGLSRTGYSLHFSGVTLTGTGILYLRHRIYSKDARHFKNQKGSFSGKVSHDTGSGIDYTVFVRKANAEDDFSAVTEIANSGAQTIASGAGTALKLENIDMGNCANGIEIEIKIECGAITAKNFEFAELQFEVSQVVTVFDLRHFFEEEMLCGYSIFDLGTKLVFPQPSAPLGWTQITAHNDKALRVVSGVGGGSGGSLALSSATTGNHTLLEGEIPGHTHEVDMWATGSGGAQPLAGNTGDGGDATSKSTGGDGAHNHPLALAYVDVIIAEFTG